jgi:hypothetical protein
VKNDTNSFRNFPADLLFASCLPTLLVAFATSWLLTLHGWRWSVAFTAAILVALIGATDLFRAKLPLYRHGRFFTLGSRDLPPRSAALYRRGCRLSIIGIAVGSLLVAGASLWRPF